MMVPSHGALQCQLSGHVDLFCVIRIGYVCINDIRHICNAYPSWFYLQLCSTFTKPCLWVAVPSCGGVEISEPGGRLARNKINIRQLADDDHDRKGKSCLQNGLRL